MMNTKNSSITLVAYQGEHLPIYNILGSITGGIIEAYVKDGDKEVAQVRGLIRKTGYLFLRIAFYNQSHKYIDFFGRVGEDVSISEVKLDDVDQSFLLEGVIDKQVVADFTLINLEGVVSFLITGDIISK